MLAYTCHPRTQELETSALVAQGQPWLQSKAGTRPGCVRPCLRNKRNQTKLKLPSVLSWKRLCAQQVYKCTQHGA